MQASSFWQRYIGTIESGDLADLRRDMILEIGVVTFVIGWLATLAAIGYEGRLEYLLTALILLAGSMASFLLRPTHYQVALHVLIATVLCAITCLKWFVADRLAQYYFPVAIVVSSLLVPSGRVFVLAVIASLACMAMARSQNANWLDSLQIVTPITLIYLTAFTAWLGSRQVNMALGWMHNSYRKAERLVDELRDERMSLALRAFSDPSTATDWGAIFAMSSLSLVPVFALFVFFQKYLVRGISTTGLHG